MQRACETCTYFEADPNRDQGECRRHAPKHGTTNAMWPTISKYAWCGEYDTRELAAAAPTAGSDTPYPQCYPYPPLP